MKTVAVVLRRTVRPNRPAKRFVVSEVSRLLQFGDKIQLSLQGVRWKRQWLQSEVAKSRIAIFIDGLHCLEDGAVVTELACELGRLASEVAPASMPNGRCDDGARDDDGGGSSFLRNLSGEGIVAMQAAGSHAYRSVMQYGAGWPVGNKARYGPAAEAVLRELGDPPGGSPK